MPKGNDSNPEPRLHCDTCFPQMTRGRNYNLRHMLQLSTNDICSIIHRYNTMKLDTTQPADFFQLKHKHAAEPASGHTLER